MNRHLDSTTKEVKYNPKYEELFAPEVCKRIFNYDKYEQFWRYQTKGIIKSCESEKQTVQWSKEKGPQKNNQTMVHKALHRKLRIEKHDIHCI